MNVLYCSTSSTKQSWFLHTFIFSNGLAGNTNNNNKGMLLFVRQIYFVHIHLHKTSHRNRYLYRRIAASFLSLYFRHCFDDEASQKCRGVAPTQMRWRCVKCRLCVCIFVINLLLLLLYFRWWLSSQAKLQQLLPGDAIKSSRPDIEAKFTVRCWKLPNRKTCF